MAALFNGLARLFMAFITVFLMGHAFSTNMPEKAVYLIVGIMIGLYFGEKEKS
jgi:hypothetical protein